MWHEFTLAANRRELIVSFVQLSLGDTFTNISVLALPPNACWRRNVSLEFLKGTWLSLAESAIITLPRLESDLLMCFVSVRRSPVAPDSFKRSDPARSTIYSTPKRKQVSYKILKIKFPLSFTVWSFSGFFVNTNQFKSQYAVASWRMLITASWCYCSLLLCPSKQVVYLPLVSNFFHLEK